MNLDLEITSVVSDFSWALPGARTIIIYIQVSWKKDGWLKENEALFLEGRKWGGEKSCDSSLLSLPQKPHLGLRAWVVCEWTWIHTENSAQLTMSTKRKQLDWEWKWPIFLHVWNRHNLKYQCRMKSSCVKIKLMVIYQIKIYCQEPHNF